MVCAISGADRDRRTLEIGTVLARAFDFGVVLVHVRAPMITEPVAPHVAGATIDPAVAQQAQLYQPSIDLPALARDAGVPNADCRVLEGRPAALLEQVCREPRTAWLVLGDGGDGPLMAALRGSVSRQLLRSCACPVAVVPEALADPLHSPVTVAAFVTDDSAAEQVTATAGTLARALNGSVVLVHVAGTTPRIDESDRVRVEHFLERCARRLGDGVTWHSVAAIGPETDALLDTAREERADILVSGAPAHGMLHAALLGSTTERLLRNTKSVLVLVPSDSGT